MADQCEWGQRIVDAFNARPVAAMPKGWRRIFEDHWSCTPAVLFYAPGTSPMHYQGEAFFGITDPVVTVTRYGVSVEHVGVDIDPDEFALMARIAASDYAWLKAHERDHGLDCSHAAEARPKLVREPGKGGEK